MTVLGGIPLSRVESVVGVDGTEQQLRLLEQISA